MSDIYNPIFRGYVPFQIMDEVPEDFAKEHGIRASSAVRFFWLTKSLIVAIEFPNSQWQYKDVVQLPAVRCVLRVNKYGHLDNLGVEGLMEPEAQDALKSWTVLAQMAPRRKDEGDS